jgi:hypothetical protein
MEILKKNNLLFIEKNCTGNKHLICENNVLYLKNNINELTTDMFDKFVNSIIGLSSYVNCLSGANKNYLLITDFIILASSKIKINPVKMIIMMQFIYDDILEKILINQTLINKNYIEEILLCKNAKTYYGSIINVPYLFLNSVKIKSFNYIMQNIGVKSFFDIMNIFKEHVLKEYEKPICEFITKNKELLKTNKLFDNFINNYLNKPMIFKSIYKIMVLTKEKKMDLLNKVASSQTFEPSIFLVILEENDIIPNETTINNLLSKINSKNYNVNYFKIIAEIFDIFVLYGFIITKKLIIQLIRKRCYVNCIEKYNIEIDNEILEECAMASYYPYNYSCVPSTKIMLIECKKEDNLQQIKKLKEKGGVLTYECLENACGVKKNAKVIKFLINECKLKPTQKCLTNFQTTYGIEALDFLMLNYDNNQDKKDVKTNNKIIIDNDSTLSIDKKNIEINKEVDYLLKVKIAKLLNYNKTTIKYNDLYELMLKYLINNKLIIANFFVINSELSKLLKINQCSIINIDQLDNILSYFINNK